MGIYRSKRRYYVKVMAKGTIYHAHEGFEKKEDALQALAQLKLKTKSLPRHTITLQSFLRAWHRYLDHCKSHHSLSWYKTKKYIGDKCFAKWYDKKVREITPMDIEEHLLERRKLSASTANHDLEILRSFFNWCVKMDILEKSPCRSASKFPVNKKVHPIPTKEDVDRLIQANTGQDQLLILLLVYTMGRIGEIENLAWKDIDFDKNILYLKTHKGRGGTERIREIPLTPQLREALLAHRGHGGYYVLRSPKDGSKYKDPRQVLKRCFKKADLPYKKGFHQFRRYGASMLADKGTPLNVVQDLLGHTTLDTTNIYLQSLRESKRKAMEAL